MGKGKRLRRIRKEAHEIAMDYGSLGRPKPLARYYRREALKLKRRKSPSKPKGPTVWRWPR